METISHEIRGGVMSMPHVHNETFMSNGYEVLEDDHPAEDEFDLPIDEDSPQPNSSRENTAGDFLAYESSTNNNHSKPNRIFQHDRYTNLRVQFPNDEQLSPQTIQKVVREQKQALALQLKELETIENTQNAVTGHQANGASKQLLMGTTWEQKLQPFLNAQGGIADPQYVPKLMQLLAEEKNTNVLLMFARALLHSHAKVHKRFVESRGLKEWLRTWLHSSDAKLVVASLDLFVVVPISEEQLKASHLEEIITDLLNNTSMANQAAKAFKKIAAVKAHSQSLSKPTASNPSKVAKAPAEKQKLTPSNESIFGGEEPAPQPKPVVPKGLQKRIAPDYLKPRKHKMQVVDMEETGGKENVEDATFQKKKGISLAEKPMSADAIKKAKLKEKYLDNAPHTSSPPLPLSPPSASESTPTPTQQAMPSPPLSTSTPEPSIPPTTTISAASGYPIEPPLKKQRLPPSVTVPPLSIPPPAPSPVPEAAPAVSTGEDDVWDVASNAPPEEEIPFEPPTPYSKKTGKLKKKVTWVTDDKLEACKYFYKESAPNAADDSGTAPEAAPAPMHQMTHAEFEKHRLEDVKRERADRSAAGTKKVIPQPTVRWRVPPLMEYVGVDTRGRGQESKQVAIQTDRETKVLNLYFMDDSKTPNTPSEPDTKQEEYDDSRVKLIASGDERHPAYTSSQQYQQHPQQQPQQQQARRAASSPTPSFDSNALSSLLQMTSNMPLARPPQMQPQMQQQMQPQLQPQMSPPMQQMHPLQAQLPPQMQAQLQQQLQQMQQILQQPGQLQQLQPQQLQQLQQQLQQMQGLNLLGQVNPAVFGMQVQQAQQMQQMLQQQQQLHALQALQQQQQQQQLLPNFSGFQLPGANQPGLFQGVNPLQQLQQLQPQQLQQLQQQLQLQQLAPTLQNINPMLLNSLLQNQQSGQPPQSFPQQQQQHRYRS